MRAAPNGRRIVMLFTRSSDSVERLVVKTARCVGGDQTPMEQQALRALFARLRDRVLQGGDMGAKERAVAWTFSCGRRVGIFMQAKRWSILERFAVWREQSKR